MLQTNSQIVLTNQIERTEGKTLEKLSSPKGRRKLPIVKDFGVFYLYRSSDNTNVGGDPVAPFKSAEIKMVIDSEAKAGEKITMIPLQVEIEPFQLAISKVTKKKYNGCDEPKKDFHFEIEFEEITDKIVLEVEPVDNQFVSRAFPVFAIYPSVDFAKNILPPELKQEMIPKGVAIQTVEAAIDLDNDGKPDLLSTSFCCADENKPVNSVDENCYYSCEKIFRKINRSWKLIRSESPC
ncbi:MAG TPA: hypothetical protein VK892_13370 [Pyrinomonadaceae bacterium]|nr:hypothetical protein [Pyrinomonadaceae bacterium]